MTVPVVRSFSAVVVVVSAERRVERCSSTEQDGSGQATRAAETERSGAAEFS